MKASKVAKTYTLATQGIFSMAVYTGIGFLIGYLINKKSAWPAILAVVGMLIGLFTFITYLLYLLKEEEKEKLNAANKKEEDK